MPITSRAQNFEDVILWRALGHISAGSYLDIGAQHPVRDSVSLVFYEAGWRGLHVEPTPLYASLLRAARPDEIIIEAAVSDKAGPIEFYEIPETGLSTGQWEIAAEHQKSGFESRTILVPTVSLDGLFDRFTELHWMKIDVEGMEREVLTSWGDNPMRPWIVVVEATRPLQQVPSHFAWCQLLNDRGYEEIYFDGLSRYYVHESRRELATHFESPPNVFDQFTVSADHFAASSLIAGHAKADALARARIGELSGELASLADQLHTSEAERDAAYQALGDSNGKLTATAEELANIRAAYDNRMSALAEVEHEHAHAVDRLWRERLEAELRLRQEWREQEQGLQESLRSAEAELANARVSCAALSERGDHQAYRIELMTAAERQHLQDIEELRGRLNAQTEQAERALRDLNHELERSASQLAAAVATMEKALAEPVGRWQRLGQALGIASEDQARRTLRSWPASDGPISSKDMETTMSAASPCEGRNPYLRADTLVQLLAWNDVDFVRCAYVTVLGRQPDPEGEAYYSDRIRRGHSKLEILRQLRRSVEGRMHDPGIAGFDRALKRSAWERGALGFLIRPITGGEGDGAPWRRHRVLVNLTGRFGDDQQRLCHHVHQLDHKLDQTLDGLQTVQRPQTPDPAVELGSAGESMPVSPDLNSRARQALKLLQQTSAKA